MVRILVGETKKEKEREDDRERWVGEKKQVQKVLSDF